MTRRSGLAITGAVASASLLFGMVTVAPAWAAEPTVDQSTLSLADTGGAVSVGVDGVNTSQAGMVFTAGLTGSLTAIRITILRRSVSPNLTVSIYETSGSLQTAVPGALISSQTLSSAVVADIPSIYTPVTLTLPTPVPIVQDHIYAFAFSSSTNEPGGGPFVMPAYTITRTAYPRGNPVTRLNSAAWATSDDVLLFATYVAVPDAASSPPLPWMQGYARQGDDGCIAGWNPSWAQWPNGNTGGFVCVRTMTYNNATGGWDARRGRR